MGRIYDLFISKYNYTDFHELNLDWLIAAVKQFEYEMENFVAINAVKYADPIQWDITRQYEKNTIVIDPITGTAYISAKAVPMGVALSREDYWNVVFDLGRFITLSAQNFANTYEALPTTTATMETPKDGWIVWNTTLYKALNDIHVGDMYVVDGNIKHCTVEYFFNLLKSAIYQETEDRIAEDTRIELSLTDLITSKVNTEAQARSDEDTILDGRITQEVTDRTNADNAIDTTIGDLANLNTSDKTSVVNAINSVFADMKFEPFTRTTRYFTEFNVTDTSDGTHNACADFDVTKLSPVNVLDYGLVADGVTDNTTALLTLLSEHKVVYFPKQSSPYYFNGTVIISDGSYIKGEDTDLKFGASASFYVRSNTTIDGFSIDCNVATNAIIFDTNNGNVINSNVRNIIIKNPAIGIKDNGGTPGAGNAHLGYDIKIQDVKIYNPHGTGGVVTGNLFGFILFERVMIDFTEYPTTPTNYGFYMEGVEGVTFIRCDVLGRGLTEPTSANTSVAFFVKGAAIWFNKCMVDTVAGFAFNCQNSTYVYFTDCIASLMYNSGIYLDNCNFVQIDRFFGYGRKGVTSGTNINYNSGIILSNVTKATITNISLTNFKDYAIYLAGTSRLCIASAIQINDCEYGLYEVDTSNANQFTNVYIGATHLLSVIGAYTVLSSILYVSGATTQYHQGSLTV